MQYVGNVMESNTEFNPMEDPEIDEIFSEQLIDFSPAFTIDKVYELFERYCID